MAIRIKKKALIYLALLTILLCSIEIVLFRTKSVFSPNNDEINADIEVSVQYIIEKNNGQPGHLPISDKSYAPITNARVILIDDKSGEIINTGMTNEEGIWKTNITVNRDLRFKDKKIGTITVIAIANGYNETIHFNVPINEYGKNHINRSVITLRHLDSKERNEPSYKNAGFHRFTVYEMLNCYAEKLSLERQPVFEKGEVPPWSPHQN